MTRSAAKLKPKIEGKMTASVVIAGGGMVGMATALALAKQGIASTVLEAGRVADYRKAGFDGRTCALAYGTQQFLDQIGAWGGMASQACPILDIRIVDGSLVDGPSSLYCHYDHRDVGGEPMGYIVENRHIRIGLLEALEQEPLITLVEQARVEQLTQTANRASITLQDGRIVDAALVIAADGKFSRVRDQAGIAYVDRPYEQTAIVCTVAHEFPHEGLALEEFLPSGPYAVLPMQGDAKGVHRSSIVWTEKRRYADGFLALDEVSFNAELQRRFGDYLGEVAVQGERFAYPLGLRYAETLYKGRVVLVGDAGHAIHPIAGQGVNLGYRDVAVLAEILGERMRLGLDAGSAEGLEAYHRARQFDIHTMIEVTDSLTHLFSNANPILRLGRRLGLSAVNHLPPVKKMLMRHAMGILFALPDASGPEGLKQGAPRRGREAEKTFYSGRAA